jgi:hypothetical protein
MLTHRMKLAKLMRRQQNMPYHVWTEPEMITLAALRCFTNANWAQTVRVLNEQFPDNFEPPLAINKAQEKFKDMRRRMIQTFTRVYNTWDRNSVEMRELLHPWLAAQMGGAGGLQGLIIMDRRMSPACTLLPRRHQGSTTLLGQAGGASGAANVAVNPYDDAPAQPQVQTPPSPVAEQAGAHDVQAQEGPADQDGTESGRSSPSLGDDDGEFFL